MKRLPQFPFRVNEVVKRYRQSKIPMVKVRSLASNMIWQGKMRWWCMLMCFYHTFSNSRHSHSTHQQCVAGHTGTGTSTRQCVTGHTSTRTSTSLDCDTDTENDCPRHDVSQLLTALNWRQIAKLKISRNETDKKSHLQDYEPKTRLQEAF